MAQNDSLKIKGGPKTVGFIKEASSNSKPIPFKTDTGVKVDAIVKKIISYGSDGKELTMRCNCITPKGKTQTGVEIVYNVPAHTGTIKGLVF